MPRISFCRCRMTRWCTASVPSRPDAGRRLAAFCQFARLLRPDVGLPRQEAAVYGPGIRPGAGVGFRRRARLAPAGAGSPPWRADADRRPEPALPEPACAACARLRTGRVPLAGGGRCRAIGVRLAAAGAGCRPRGLHRQFHPGTALELPHRPAVRRPLGGGTEYRCHAPMADRAWAMADRSTAEAGARTGSPPRRRFVLPPLAAVWLVGRPA